MSALKTDLNKKEATPFFSIIVPVYKTEQYIHQCVESIINQTYTDFEAVLVDDGSPDSCPQICDEYAAKDNRIKVVHKQNGGLVSARKAGLEECVGKYIINIDSDDYIASDYLERFTEIILRHSPDIIINGVTFFSESGQTVKKPLIPAGLYEKDNLKTIHDNIICDSFGQQNLEYGIALAAVERQIYTTFQLSVDQNISRGEDLAVTAPILANSKSVYILDSCGYFYRDNPTSIMNTFRRNEPEQIKLICSYLKSKLGSEYQNKLNLYAASHYFDFLDRAMLIMSLKEYKQLIKETLDDELSQQIKHARVKGLSSTALIFMLLRYRLFGMLWLLRKIKPRQA